MLEKNLNFLYFDAHFHIFDCIEQECFVEHSLITGCSCAHAKEEYEVQQKYPSVIQSYGIHPQNAAKTDIKKEAEFLERLILTKKISCIGEAGFDFYTDELKSSKELQENGFNIQLELALKYKKTLIIHCRKANEKLFEYSSLLAKLPSVLFHSFMGTDLEAKSLINKNINCYFSFGKQIFNNNKKAIACVKNIPEERLLLETDAPFQFLKNENKTYSDEIIKVYEGAYELKKAEGYKKSYEEFCLQLQKNFHSLYNDL